MFAGRKGWEPAASTPDDVHSELTDLVDVLLDRVDVALDRQRAALMSTPGAAALPTEAHRAAAASRSGAAKDRARMFKHNRADLRVQACFDPPVDNSNTPFVLPPPVAHPSPPPGSQPPEAHPLAEMIAALRPDWLTAAPPPPAPLRGALDASTPMHWVDTPEALADLGGALAGEAEIAVDLEAHSFRSFQGFVCLMQISTRSADYLVDCLALRSQLRPALGAVFEDGSVAKVMHGADSDVLWLQRDFGLYVLGLVDTGQAARVLGLPSAGLAHLLERFAGFKPNKAFQMADWRVRPLPDDLADYARCDTHFLLGAWDALRRLLAATPGGLAQLAERSAAVAATVYAKPRWSEDAYAADVVRCGRRLDSRQLAVYAALFDWRDRCARLLDESLGSLLPHAALTRLAVAMPDSARGVLAALQGQAQLAAERAAELACLIARAKLAAPPPGAERLLAPLPPADVAGTGVGGAEALAAAAGEGAAGEAPTKREAERVDEGAEPRQRKRRVVGFGSAAPVSGLGSLLTGGGQTAGEQTARTPQTTAAPPFPS